MCAFLESHVLLEILASIPWQDASLFNPRLRPVKRLIHVDRTIIIVLLLPMHACAASAQLLRMVGGPPLV